MKQCSIYLKKRKKGTALVGIHALRVWNHSLLKYTFPWGWLPSKADKFTERSGGGLKPQATLGRPRTAGKAFLTEKAFLLFSSEASQGPLSASDTESGSVLTCVAGACVFTLWDSWLKGPFLSTSSPLTLKPRMGPAATLRSRWGGGWGGACRRGRGGFWLLREFLEVLAWPYLSWGARWWKATHRELFRDRYRQV